MPSSGHCNPPRGLRRTTEKQDLHRLILGELTGYAHGRMEIYGVKDYGLGVRKRGSEAVSRVLGAHVSSYPERSGMNGMR